MIYVNSGVDEFRCVSSSILWVQIFKGYVCVDVVYYAAERVDREREKFWNDLDGVLDSM